MTKVISFKVPDDVYQALKKNDKNFRELFEPIAIIIANKNHAKTQYTGGIRQKECGEGQILKDVEKFVDQLNTQKK